jgi:hypothetical protein
MTKEQAPGLNAARERANTTFLGVKLKLNTYKTRVGETSLLEKEKMGYSRR